LDPGDDLSSFCCDKDDDLGCNDFIHKEEEAKLFQKERQGITYLFFIDGIMVGYATLAMSSLPAERMERRFRKTISLSFYPSLLIGRLGVSNDWRRKGIGEYICNWCVGLAIDLSDKIGCRYVILETSKGERETFYAKCNFQKAKELVDDRKERVWMYQRIDIL
jgi:GNAT superfamily N-acetyltransferase